MNNNVRRIDYTPQYKDFPEFERDVPEIITFSDDFIDKLAVKAERERNPKWRTRMRGGMSKQKPTKQGWFPPEKRIEVATAFVAGITNAKRLEELTKVPSATIRKWKTCEWWGDLLSRVKYEKDAEIEARFTGVIDKTLNRIEDALEQGDEVVTRTGETIRRPVIAKDAAAIQANIFKHRQLIRGEPTSRTETINNAEMMKKLAEQYRQFAGAPKVIEGEVVSKEITTNE